MQSQYSATALPLMSQSGAPMAVNVQPDPLLLERVVTKRQLTALLEPENGNGNGYGNGYGSNGYGNSGYSYGNDADSTFYSGSLDTWNGSVSPDPWMPANVNEENGASGSIDFAPTCTTPPNNSSEHPSQFLGGLLAAAGALPQQQFTGSSSTVNLPEALATASEPLAQSSEKAIGLAGAGAGMIAGFGAAGPGMSWYQNNNFAADQQSYDDPTTPHALAATPMAQSTPTAPSAIPASNEEFFSPVQQAERSESGEMPFTSSRPAVSEFFARAFKKEEPATESEPDRAERELSKEDDYAPVHSAAPNGGEFELAERSDFFASSSAPKAKSTENKVDPASRPPESRKGNIGDEFNLGKTPLTDAPPVTKEKPTDNTPPPVTTSGVAASSKPHPASAQAAMDFFASSGPTVARNAASKRWVQQDEDEEEFEFPDEVKKPAKRPAVDPFEEFEEKAPPVAAPQVPKRRKDDVNEEVVVTRAKRPAKVEEEDEHDAEQEDEPATDRPKRRSFSDPKKRTAKSSASTKTSKPSKKSGKAKDDGDNEGDEEENNKSFFDVEVPILGLRLKLQVLVMLLAVATFLLLVILNSAGQLIQAAGGNIPGLGSIVPQQQAPLAGKWNIHTVFEGNTQQGELVMRVDGNKIEGSGRDALKDGMYEFRFLGQVTGDKVKFTKEYVFRDQNGQVSKDKPIFFDGKLTVAQGYAPYMKGIWQTERSVGYSWRKRMLRFTGPWEAQLASAEPASGSQQQPPAAPGSESSNLPPPPSSETSNPLSGLNPSQDGYKDPKGLTNVWTFYAIIWLLICVGCVAGSLYIFGPGGKMNYWEKEKYIPSQFRSQHKKMVSELSKPAQPGGLPFGRRCEYKPWKFWMAKDLALTPEIRKTEPHILILGASDKGKSRLIAHMLSHDIESNDRAVVLIDSDGGLVSLITRWIAAHPKAKEISKRVMILDPTHKGNQLAYNPLQMPEDDDLQSAASAIVHGFKAIYTEPPGSQSQWNAQTANILRNAALLLMANGRTLADLPTLLHDNDFRDILLEGIEKRKRERAEFITLIDTWGQYKKLARTDQWITWVEPILNRVTPMLGDARIRNVLTRSNGDIKLRQLIQQKKILLVKVAKGQLDQNANLLGSLIVTGLKQAALSLANDSDESKQNPVTLYLDEFDNFIEKDTIEAITSETDKFKIGFVGCSKTIQQLPEDFRNQIVLKVNTLICFALAKKDGDLLGPQMFRVDGRKIKHQTIQNFFNKVNTSPQFELISDEEKLNIDRIIGQEARTFYAYRVGSPAGVFHMKAHDFLDIEDKDLNKKWIDKMHGLKNTDKEKEKESSAAA